MSDNSFRVSDSSDDESNPDDPPPHKIPSNVRQIKLHLQKVQNDITEMQMYAVYFESTFYIGQVQKLFYSCEEEIPENLTDVEMKYLKWVGDDKFWWPAKEDVGLVKPYFIFDGPIQTLSFEPFLIRSIGNVRALFNNLKKFRDEIFRELSSAKEETN